MKDKLYSLPVQSVGTKKQRIHKFVLNFSGSCARQRLYTCAKHWLHTCAKHWLHTCAELILAYMAVFLRMESESSDKNVKLWIGNLDIKLDEFQLLKILEKFGKISSFDFLYHINERGGRIPRGYAFVTYQSVTSAVEALKVLHKTKILTKVQMIMMPP